MISSFWNLCRACPSMPVEKLHSEYRSTFQWHEYVGSHSDSVTQAPVVRQPSQSHQDQLSILTGRPEDPPFPRRKKHPELANRSSNGWLTKSSTAYEASLCPESRFTNISGSGGGGGGGGGGPRKSLSMGTIRSSGNIASIHSPKLSLMPEYKRSAVDDTEPVMSNSAPEGMSGFTESKTSGGEAAFSNFMPSQSAEAKFQVGKELEGTQEQRHDDFKKKEYKSEYKKRFRPFSQYEYVDGRFFKKKGDQEIENPWYKEVIELRKKAGEYKFRGWGTELGPQNIAQVYHQHVWDQVSRRTSLAALALITTTPKSISKEEKDKENAKKSYPGKPTHARPHTATPKHPISDLEKSKHLKDTDAVQPSKKKLLEESRIQNKPTARVKELKTTSPRPPSYKPTLENKSKKLLREARSHSAGPAGRSPRKAIRQQSAASSVSEKDNTAMGGWKIHLDSTQVENAPNKPIQRHPRPTTLATSPRPKASSGKGDRDPNSKLAKQQQFDKNSADPYLGYNEPVVKSPPEPTRVKSPEQVILRSPDPVNWTVPLDTTKSFTVTQNIREAPPSPRFRAGEKLHGEIRNIHHTTSTHHSSAGSTIASSPISSFSTRSAPVPLSNSSGQPGASVPPKSVTAATTATTVSQGGSTKSTVTSLTERENTEGVEVGGSGSGGISGGGKPDVSGAGPGTGDGSTSMPSQTSKLEQKVPQTQSTHQNINGFDDKAAKTLQKDKVTTSPPVKAVPPQPRMGVGAVRSKDIAKVTTATPVTPPLPGTVSTAIETPLSMITTSSVDKVKPTATTAPSVLNSSVITTQPSAIPVSSDKSKPKSNTGPVLRCLEDPTFMFDPPAPKQSAAPVVSKVPDMTKSVINIPPKPTDTKQTSSDMTKSVMNIPSKPTDTKQISSDMTKSVMNIPPKPTDTKQISSAPSKIPEFSKALPAPPKVPDVPKSAPSTAIPSKIPDPPKTVATTTPSKMSETPKSVSSIPISKIPDPVKPVTPIMSTKLQDPIKPVPIIPSKIPDPIKPAPMIPTKLPDPIKPAPIIPSKLPEPPKSIPSGVSKIPEPFKAGSTVPSKIPEPTSKSMTTSSGKLPDTPVLSGPSVHTSGIRPPSAGGSGKSSFKVLEAPPSPPITKESKKKDVFVPPAPVAAPKRSIGGISHVSETPPPAKGSGYRVLEAPDDPAEPTVSVISPNSGRSRASDVLEKARHRFDKFWGGKSKDEEK
ncbi:unnamed protein product [Allacma fusca]|uniref:Nuclear protein MDM1 n=1 Tax=Allacma fusca TaxID=39272 RepID=A0A8J2LVA3_9HEXA|nr:unnamed protein product [Allacma fusca]